MRRLFLSFSILVLALLLTPASLFAAGPSQSQAAMPWRPPTPAYKIHLKETGLYRISYAELAAAGLPVDDIDPRTFQMFDQGQEIAIIVQGEEDGSFDPNDGIVFFGEYLVTRYVEMNNYWLTYGHARGHRIQERENIKYGMPLPSYPERIRSEVNQIYISTLPLEVGHDHWYGPSIQAIGQDHPGSRSFYLTLDHVADDGLPILSALFAGNVVGTHHIQIYVNDHLVHDGSWKDRKLYNINTRLPQSVFIEGRNEVKVVLVNDTPYQAFDMIYVDWGEMHYGRQLIAKDDALYFEVNQSGRWEYNVSNFSTNKILAFDVTDPFNVKQFVVDAPLFSYTSYLPLLQAPGSLTTQAAAAPQSHSILFGDDITSAHRYLAVADGRYLSVESISLDTPSDIQNSTTGADYIVITHRDFWEAAQQIATYRGNQGMRTTVIDVQDIYDEFNDGLMSAESIHDFLAYAYTHWPAPAPKYVLLIGDGTYDMRHYMPNTAPTYIPPYLTFIDTLLGEAASDNRFVTLIGPDNLPEMHIGRMTANTLQQAQDMVGKTIAYETNPAPGNWNQNVLFVTDDLENSSGDFYDLSDELADGYVDPPTNTVKYLPPQYNRIKIYAGRTCDLSNPSVSVECKQQIVDTLEGPGALIMNYIGHATKDYWAAERIMDQATIENVHNEGKWPVTLAMSCVDGFFHQAPVGSQSFAEANVRAKGGSVASWSATSLGLTNPHQLLEKGLFLSLFHDNTQPTLGAAITSAKYYMVANAPQLTHYLEAVDAYMLFGDPALRVKRWP